MQIAQVLDLDCPVSDNGTAERQSCPRLPDQASPTSVPSEELAQDACHQQNGVSICASATIKNTFTQTASPCQRRHSNVTDLSTAVRNTCTTLSLYDQCVRSRPKQDASTSTVDRQMCDRSTQPSPTADEAFAADSWRKERLLGAKIVEMQDRLKDTEERYKSAKMQLDTLSVAYRTMHESHSALQQDNDKLQFDVRSITKCADFLRAQLHGAQCDRDAANELQKLLQSELEVSRAEKRKVQDSTEKDRRTIQDLQRQCREMERILMRKTPDTVSTLIAVGCKTKEEQDGPSPSSNRQELVQRIAQLKADATARGLDDVQARFNAVQAKYETHIADLEMQVLSLQEINTKLSEKIIRQTEELGSVVPVPVAPPTATCYTQTDLEGEAFRVQPPANAPVRSISVQTDETGPSEPVATGTTRQPPPTKKRTAQTTGASTATAAPVAPGKEDAHLLATIRGMRAELASKEKSVQRLTRELDECKKTIRKLQKKKEMPAVGQVAGAMAVPGKGDTGRSPAKLRNRDDPEHMGAMLREAESKVKVLEHDYTALQEKQLQDLKTLEACHVQERETFRESIRCLQQRLAESEEKLLQRSNLGNDYYRLKTKVELECCQARSEVQTEALVVETDSGAARAPHLCPEVLADGNWCQTIGL
uniref:Centrosomal protein of 162 kDa n=1 Tax=Anopheles dirus TaxID=7168 RepID=A0A182NVG8_9DIPT